MKNFQELETKLNREIANNDIIMFIGLSALIVLLGISYIAHELFPKASLTEFSMAVIVSIVWLIVRQELMIHRADGYLALCRKALREETKVTPLDWVQWRTYTSFRLLTLVVSDVLMGMIGWLLLFRAFYPYPTANEYVAYFFSLMIAVGIVMIPITIVQAKKNPYVMVSNE